MRRSAAEDGATTATARRLATAALTDVQSPATCKPRVDEAFGAFDLAENMNFGHRCIESTRAAQVRKPTNAATVVALVLLL